MVRCPEDDRGLTSRRSRTSRGPRAVPAARQGSRAAAPAGWSDRWCCERTACAIGIPSPTCTLSSHVDAAPAACAAPQFVSHQESGRCWEATSAGLSAIKKVEIAVKPPRQVWQPSRKWTVLGNHLNRSASATAAPHAALTAVMMTKVWETYAILAQVSLNQASNAMNDEHHARHKVLHSHVGPGPITFNAATCRHA